MAITITPISIQKENLTMKWDLEEDDMDEEKSVSCEDVLRRIPQYEMGKKGFTNLLPGNWSPVTR